VNPNAKLLWRAPLWALSILLATLGMLGPFSVDTYIPAFSAIAGSLGATPVEMQQTLSGYLMGFAVMSLFHGAISDSVGRRPVVLWGLAAFTLASLGCALSQTIEQFVFFRTLQGISSGAGIVVARAVVRDMFAPSQAQRVMSQITLFFGVAPAIAPLIGGWLLVWFNWHSIFWFLVLVGLAQWVANYKLLPETLAPEQRQPFEVKHLMRGYWKLGSDPRFFLLALASGVPFNGMFLYVLSAPAFLGELLALAPTQFFWLFIFTISGIMTGAWLSGRNAGKLTPKRQIRLGFLVLLVAGCINLAANMLFKAEAFWALWPIAFLALGWAIMTPSITLLVLDLHPERRGMASSLQTFITATVNALVAGVLAPLVMYSTQWLAACALGFGLVGLVAWLGVHSRWPDLGRSLHGAH
jgi:DHA1 family bicyclomycin/chloramphenicol resistance-like MFS transporter